MCWYDQLFTFLLPNINHLCYNAARGDKMTERQFRCYVYKAAPKQYLADCLDLTLMGEGETPQQAMADLHEIILGYLETVYASGEQDAFIPRRAPLYRWFRFYKHLILNSLRAIFALHFDGFIAYEQPVTGDVLAYA